MKWISRCQLRGIIGGMLTAFLFGPSASCGSHKDHPWRYSDVDMPVSLAVGTVRTPEFAVKREAYFIMIQVEKPLPIVDMQCMMGLRGGYLDAEDCKKAHKETLLQADWTVWDGDKMVAKGSNPDHDAGMFTDKYIFKIFGPFMGESGKNYVVEMKFTNDGSPLNVANPHLIVISVRKH